LLRLAWWEWSDEQIFAMGELFNGDVETFLVAAESRLGVSGADVVAPRPAPPDRLTRRTTLLGDRDDEAELLRAEIAVIRRTRVWRTACWYWRTRDRLLGR
jgi:hypothetical protein